MLNTLPQSVTPVSDDISPAAEDDNVFLQDVVQKNNSTDNLWTFIYRGPKSTILSNNRINAILIRHDAHYHADFQTMAQNRNRTLQRLL